MGRRTPGQRPPDTRGVNVRLVSGCLGAYERSESSSVVHRDWYRVAIDINSTMIHGSSLTQVSLKAEHSHKHDRMIGADGGTPGQCPPGTRGVIVGCAGITCCCRTCARSPSAVSAGVGPELPESLHKCTSFHECTLLKHLCYTCTSLRI